MDFKLTRFHADDSQAEEISLISRGVQSLRTFVEHLQSEGGTQTTHSHLRDASKLFAKADRRAGIKLDNADQDLISLLAEEKSVTDEMLENESKVNDTSSLVKTLKEQAKIHEENVDSKRSLLEESERDVSNARRKLEKEKEDAIVRQVAVGAGGILATVCTFGLATPFVVGTGAIAIGATAITAGVGIAMVDDAIKALERHKELLSDAESNLRSAKKKLREKEKEKEELEQTLCRCRWKLQQVHAKVGTIKMRKKAISEWQALIRQTLPIIQRIVSSTKILKKDTETQFKLKASADFSLLVTPLKNIVGNVIMLSGRASIECKSMRDNVKVIELFTEDMKAINDFSEFC